jgi:hypothetical protein
MGTDATVEYHAIRRIDLGKIIKHIGCLVSAVEMTDGVAADE